MQQSDETKKSFEDSLIVSKEEQEKNRIENEKNKTEKEKISFTLGGRE